MGRVKRAQRRLYVSVTEKIRNVWSYASTQSYWHGAKSSTVTTLELLKPCNKGTKINCWEALYMLAFDQRNVLIKKQKVIDINPLYELAHTVNVLKVDCIWFKSLDCGYIWTL